MARHKVFICYSHKDQELFDELLTHLDPYSRQDLEIWTDQKIMAGAEWQPEIFRRIARADAEVVLVSPDLLASEFVSQKELPRLLAAREEGRLTLTPLFLRHANAQQLRFEVETVGDTRELDLTQMQGFNLPSEPIADLTGAGRDKALATAAEKLRQALTALPEPGARPPRPRRELTVVLERRRASRGPWRSLLRCAWAPTLS